MTAVAYSDGTAGPGYGFDRRGRRTQCVLQGMTTTLTLHDSGSLLTESYAGGTLAGGKSVLSALVMRGVNISSIVTALSSNEKGDIASGRASRDILKLGEAFASASIG